MHAKFFTKAAAEGLKQVTLHIITNLKKETYDKILKLQMLNLRPYT